MRFASLAELPFGEVNRTHGDEASRRLDAFDAVLITERLQRSAPGARRETGLAPRRGTLPCRGGTRGRKKRRNIPRPRWRRSRRATPSIRAVYARAARAFDASLRKRRPRRRRHDGDVWRECVKPKG